MEILIWISIVALTIFLAVFIYWSWKEDRAHHTWVRRLFYGGLILFTLLFVAFTWLTLNVLPERTHAEALTEHVVAGKVAWQKHVCINCHTILGNGAYYGPDLTKAWDRFVQRGRGNEKAAQAALVTFLRTPPKATAERRGMANSRVSDEEAQQLTAFLQWVSRIETNGWPPEPTRPLMRSSMRAEGAAFSLVEQGRLLFEQGECATCHSLGGGTIIGPDLIDAATKYDRTTLMKWIQNPEALYQELDRRPINPDFPEMPTLEIRDQDAHTIAEYLLSMSGKE